MFLSRKHIPASSLAEVIIAVSIIALCIGVASLVFIRSTRVTINFQDVQRQTEIQSELWKKLYQDESELSELEGITVQKELTENDSIELLEFVGADQKVIWRQDWIKND